VLNEVAGAPGDPGTGGSIILWTPFVIPGRAVGANPESIITKSEVLEDTRHHPNCGEYGFRVPRFAVLRSIETKGFLVRFHTKFHTFSADFVCLGVTYYVPLTRSPAIL
jgi:hypothetical protein